MRVLELFAGHGTISRVFSERGHFAFSVDIRSRKGICEPSLRKDVLDLTLEELPRPFELVWASPPCDVWSYANNGRHVDKEWRAKTEKYLVHLEILRKTLKLIEGISPAYFFIENPRGRMRNYPELISWLNSHGGTTKTITLSSYGFPTTKPTNLFTNALDFPTRPLAPFGRGAKVTCRFSNLTKCSRQATPEQLARDIVLFCENKLKSP